LEHPDRVPYLLNHSSEESYPEKYFSELFEKENMDIKKYLQVGIYELDFYNFDKKIDIEIDGEQHFTDKKIIESDKRRNKYLSDNGWKIIRIRWSDYQKLNLDEKKSYIKELKEKLGFI
jgi:very-short-patch-repair endonuclease